MLVFGELASESKSMFPIGYICGSRNPTEANINPTDWRYFSTKSLLILWMLAAKIPDWNQRPKIWKMGTGFLKLERLGWMPIQAVNLHHLPQMVLYIWTRESDIPFSIELRAAC